MALSAPGGRLTTEDEQNRTCLQERSTHRAFGAPGFDPSQVRSVRPVYPAGPPQGFFAPFSARRRRSASQNSPELSLGVLSDPRINRNAEVSVGARCLGGLVDGIQQKITPGHKTVDRIRGSPPKIGSKENCIGFQFAWMSSRGWHIQELLESYDTQLVTIFQRRSAPPIDALCTNPHKPSKASYCGTMHLKWWIS